MSLFGGHTTTTRADKISSFTVNTAEYGSAVPEILGTVRVSGNVIYYDDFTAHEHKKTTRAGKGGKSKSVSITYTYTVATIIGLCEGQIAGIGKIWMDKNIYQYPTDQVSLTLFNGAENQAPWAYVKSKHPEKALPYPGLAYMAGVIDLGDSGSMPSYNFEVKGKLLNTGDGIDVNPADYVRYVLDKIGLNEVNIDGLDNYRKYCREADLLISSPMDDTGSTKSAREVINDIMTLTGAFMFWSNDRFKIVPRETRQIGAWVPNKAVMYDLTADDFLAQSGGALVTYTRKDSSEIYNQYPVEFINRANGYEKETVSYALVNDIEEYGLRQAGTTEAHYLYTKERAVKVAERLAREALYGRNQYTFKLDWSFCRLEVGDIVTLTDANCGLDKQAVMINSVTEAKNGVITFTAVSMPEGDYAPAAYDVRGSERPYVDYNATAPRTDKPVILQPPADLTTNGLELWLGVRGTADNWGGCHVFMSDNNTNYAEVGQISTSARTGTLAKDISASDTTIRVNVNGSFISGSEEDAKNGNTRCWINGECFSYQTASLIAEGVYEFTGCVRGQDTTLAANHKAGDAFLRLDDAILKIPFTKKDIGKKIWLKFPSYNIFGSGDEDLSEVEAYEYTLSNYYIPPVSSLKAYNRYRELADGVSRYDIVVDWVPPDLSSYLQGDVWYKTNHAQGANITFKEGVTADNAGFDSEWTFGGSGKNEVVIPQAIAGDTYRICVTTKDEWGAVTSPDASPSIDILVAMKTTIPNQPDNFKVTFGKSAAASWDEVTNSDIAFYEVRADDNAGANTEGLLARVNGVEASLPLQSREGKLYLYARSAAGKYSTPATIRYNKPLPITPNAPKVTAKLGGIAIVAGAIPADCTGMNVYINDVSVHTSNNTYSYMCDAGIYDVRISYTDIFGEGEKSEAARVTVKATIDGSMIDAGTISMEKVDNAVKHAIETGGGAQDEIVQLVSDLNSKDNYNKYTAFAQLNDAIELRVKSEEVISKINMSPETITIDGKLLHVTGDTVFDANVITKGMIQAGAVTADKMSVDSLSSITANVGTLNGGTIKGTVISGGTVTGTTINGGAINGTTINGVHITGGTIDGGTVRINGYDVHSVTMQQGGINYDARPNALFNVEVGDDRNKAWFRIRCPSGFTTNQGVLVLYGGASIKMTASTYWEVWSYYSVSGTEGGDGDFVSNFSYKAVFIK